MKNTLEQLKELEREQQRLAKLKETLEKDLKEAAEQAKWYVQVLKESGMNSPRQLIKEMMRHFNIRSISLKESGDAPVAAKASSGGRRRRSKVTPDLRDKIKAALAKKVSKKQIALDYKVSYPVVKNVEDGKYD